MKSNRLLATILAICLAISLLPAAASADTTDFSVVTEAAENLYPFGATLKGSFLAPAGNNYMSYFTWGTENNAQSLNKEAVYSALDSNGGTEEQNCQVDELEPDTLYYYQAKIVKGYNSDDVLASGEVMSFRTPKLKIDGTIPAGGEITGVTFAANETKCFEYESAEPSYVTVDYSGGSSGMVNVNTKLYTKNNTSYFNGTGSTNGYKSASLIFQGKNYLSVKMHEAGTYGIKLSSVPARELQTGSNSAITEDKTVFKVPVDGRYTFTPGESTYMKLCTAQGDPIAYGNDQGVVSANIKGGQTVVLANIGVMTSSGYSVAITYKTFTQGILIDTNVAYGEDNFANEVTLEYPQTRMEADFYYGNPANCVKLVPSTIKLAASDGLSIRPDVQSARDDNFVLYPESCGTYTINVSGRDEQGNEHSGAVTIHVVPVSFGFSTTPAVTNESFISDSPYPQFIDSSVKEGYVFSGSLGTIYYYNRNASSLSDIQGLSAQIKKDDTTWAGVNYTPVDSGNGVYVLEIDIPTAECSMGVLEIDDSDGDTVYLNYRAKDLSPRVEVFTDENCTQPLSGTLALSDTPTALYFKSSDSEKPLERFIVPSGTESMAQPEYVSLSGGVQKMTFTSCVQYSQPEELKLGAVIGGVYQEFSIRATSSCGLHFKAANTGETKGEAYINDAYIGSDTYDVQVMSGDSAAQDFAITDTGDQSVATVRKDGSLLRISYVSPGDSTIKVRANGIEKSFNISSSKRVTETQWEKDARNSIYLAPKSQTTLKLTEDIELASMLEISGDADVTMDLNGHKLSYTGKDSVFQVDPGSKLTVTDSSSAKNGIIDAGKLGTAIVVTSGRASATINGGTIYGGTNKWGSTVDIQEGSVLNINGGALINNGKWACVYNTGKVVMTGGKIVCNKGTAVYSEQCYWDDDYTADTSGYFEMAVSALPASENTAFLSGTAAEPVVSGGNTGITSDGGKVVIGTGTVLADVNCGVAIQSSGQVTITGGSLAGKMGVELMSTTHTDTYNGALNATGGSIAADNEVVGADGSRTSSVSGVTASPAPKLSCAISLSVSGGLAVLSVKSDYTCAAASVIYAFYNSSGQQISVSVKAEGVLPANGQYERIQPTTKKSNAEQ